MKSFHKNKSRHIAPIFDNCRWEPSNTVPDIPDFADAFSPELDYRQKVGILPEEEPKDILPQSVGQADMLPAPPPDSLPSIAASPPVQPPIQNGVAIQKSNMQIVEDHLLSRVSIRRLYGGIYLYNGHYYGPLTEQDYLILLRRKSNEGILSILKTYRAFSDGYRFLSTNPDIEFKDYESTSILYKTFIAFKNVLLDARTGKEYKHSPEHPVFFGTNIHYTDTPADTPYWDAFLESTSQGDVSIKRLIYEMLGYLLLQGNDGKCFFVLATAPNSGKSLLGDFIGSLFQDTYVSHMAIDEFGDRFSLGGLWKTALNISMDLPQSTLTTRTVSLIKTLTGDTKITSEEKYMPKCTALNRLKLIFGTNSRIAISTPDAAFWDRVIIVPFLHEVPKQDRIPDLLSHLIAERDDIFSKSVPYVNKLIKRNYDFTLPDVAANMKREWSGNSIDALGDFFSKHCNITDTGSGTAVQEIFAYYQEYCASRNIPCAISDTANFSKTVKQRYPNIVTKKRRIAGHKNSVSVFENIEYLST